MSKYINAEELVEHLYKMLEKYPKNYQILAILEYIDSLQQEQPVTKEQISHLEHWLAFFGCPEENIEKCATQIAQNYDAIRYLEGVQRGAEAVNELAQQEQPEVDYNIIPLPEEKMARYIAYCLRREDDDCNCPTCGKHITGLRLFPYYYDLENNDVYFASVCPECGKIIISKE